MPPSQGQHFYAGANLLGEAVQERFPSLATDIDEAGKCFATGRFTATVFHLMRVMEVGVQEFCEALGVVLIDKRGAERM